jgi:FkbM family methyltransferase
MLIPFATLIDKYGIRPKGVFHIGANTGQEAQQYLDKGVENQIWIEPIPEIFEQLQKHFESNPHAFAIQACVSDKSLQSVTFNITNNNGESSSFLPLDKHLDYHPSVQNVQSIEMITITADDIIVHGCIDMEHYDFLNIDIQGAELLALKGMEKNLKHINYIYTEVNDQELYKGCALVHEIDAFLSEHGFEAAECKMTDCHWGDKFYIRKNINKG